MDNLFGFLKKYQDKLNQTKLVSLIIRETIKENVDFEIKGDSFNLRNGNLYLKTSTKVKLSVLLQKNKIMEEINKKTGTRTVFDIK